jgi:hypothetical protein
MRPSSSLRLDEAELAVRITAGFCAVSSSSSAGAVLVFEMRCGGFDVG